MHGGRRLGLARDHVRGRCRRGRVRAARRRQQPRRVQLDRVVIGRRRARHRLIVGRLLLHRLLVRHRDHVDRIIDLQQRQWRPVNRGRTELIAEASSAQTMMLMVIAYQRLFVPDNR